MERAEDTSAGADIAEAAVAARPPPPAAAATSSSLLADSEGQQGHIAEAGDLVNGNEELEIAEEDEEDNFDEEMIKLRHSISFSEVADSVAKRPEEVGDDGDEELSSEAEALARDAALALALERSDKHAHDVAGGSTLPFAQDDRGDEAAAPEAEAAATETAEFTRETTSAPDISRAQKKRALSHEQRMDAAQRARLESVSSAIDKIREVPVEISELGQSNSALLRKQLAHGRLADYFLVVGARTDGSEELAPLQHMYETGMDMRASISDETA